MYDTAYWSFGSMDKHFSQLMPSSYAGWSFLTCCDTFWMNSRHQLRSCASLWNVGIEILATSFTLSKSLVFGLPLLFFPGTVPSSVSLDGPSVLAMCPRNFNFHSFRLSKVSKLHQFLSKPIHLCAYPPSSFVEVYSNTIIQGHDSSLVYFL